MGNKFSEKKLFLILVILVVLLGIVSALEKVSATKSETPSSSPTPNFSYATTTISTPNGAIVAQIADTPDKATQGLSDRTSLPIGTGMLFVFPAPAPEYMWMKDMNFALDMVWLDQNKTVVYAVPNISPDTYKRNPPEIFFSPTNALYVIELPAGDISRLGITLGAKLNFDLTK